jgi:hypothetical protein
MNGEIAMFRNVTRIRHLNPTLLAGSAWFLEGLASLILPDSTWVLDITMIASLMLTFFAVRQVLEAQSIERTLLGRIALFLTGVTVIGAPIGQVLLATESSALEWLAVVMALGLMIGLIVTGIATLRAREYPIWVGISLILAQFGAVAVGIALSPISPLADHGDYTGAMAHGIVWLLIWHSIFSDRPEPAELSAPVRKLAPNS